MNGPDSAEIEYEEGDDESANAVMIDADDMSGGEESDDNSNYGGNSLPVGEEILPNPLDSDDEEVPDIPEESAAGDVERLDMVGDEEMGEVIDPYSNSGYTLNGRNVNLNDKQFAPQDMSAKTLSESQTNVKRFEDRYPDLYETMKDSTKGIGITQKVSGQKINLALSVPQKGRVQDGDLFSQPLDQLYKNYKAEQAQKFKNRAHTIEMGDSDEVEHSSLDNAEPIPEISSSESPSVPVAAPVQPEAPVDTSGAVAEPIDKQHMSSQIQFFKSRDNSSIPRIDTKGVIIKPLSDAGSDWKTRSGVFESGKKGGKVLVPKRQRRILARYKVIIPVIVPNLRVKMPRKNMTMTTAHP